MMRPILRCNPGPRRWLLAAISAIVLLFCFTLAAPAQQMSALIGQALDKQLPEPTIEFSGTLPQAIQMFGDLTAVRIEADDSVYDSLPWGDLTIFSAKFEHLTLRQALEAICAKLGLECTLGKDAVELRPLPALARLGRRCTVDELQALSLLRAAPLNPAAPRLGAVDLLAAIDAKLQNSPYAIENRAFVPGDKPDINVARNATLLDALEEIPLQTDATWYPWGKSVVVLKKADLVRLRLDERITTRFDGQDISSVLLELAHQSGIPFAITPGAIQKIAPQFRTLRLDLDNATIRQALESISGFTGLSFQVTDDGVSILPPAPSIASATSRPAP